MMIIMARLNNIIKNMGGLEHYEYGEGGTMMEVIVRAVGRERIGDWTFGYTMTSVFVAL